MPLSHFSAADWQTLTHAQRVEQCRRMAEEVKGLSKAASGEVKRSYTEMSGNRERLAHAMERASYTELR